MRARSALASSPPRHRASSRARCERQHRPLEVDKLLRRAARPPGRGRRSAGGSRSRASDCRRSARPAPAPAGGRAYRKRSLWPFRRSRLDPLLSSRGPAARAPLSATSSTSFSAVSSPATEISDAVGEAAAAPASAFGPADPAPELGRLERRQMAREGAVGGIEEMMAFVEDQPAQRGRRRRFLRPEQRPARSRPPPDAEPGHDWR